MESETWDFQIEVFKQMKPPLRPDVSEILLFQETAVTLAEMQRISNLHVLLLGVTKEIVELNWPRGTMLTAVDRSEAMIHHFWPGDSPNSRKIVRADWLEMPFNEGSFHLIIGDGVFNFMTYPDGYQNFARILSSLLRQDGQMCIRIFNQLSAKENTEAILEAYHKSSQVEYFEFRFRLATSLQESVEKGLYVTKESLDEYLISRGISLTELYRKSGYTPPTIPPLPSPQSDSYRISYPADSEFLAQVSHDFNVVKKLTGAHNLSYRTPMFVLSPKGRQKI